MSKFRIVEETNYDKTKRFVIEKRILWFWWKHCHYSYIDSQGMRDYVSQYTSLEDAKGHLHIFDGRFKPKCVWTSEEKEGEDG